MTAAKLTRLLLGLLASEFSPLLVAGRLGVMTPALVPADPTEGFQPRPKHPEKNDETHSAVNHQYSFKFVHIRRNVSTGAFAGLQEGAGTLVLANSGDEFASAGSSQGFDVNGNPVGTGSCSNAVGTRFKLEL